MKPFRETRISLLPSAEAAQADQSLPGRVSVDQVPPASVEVQKWPVLAAASNLFPSAEDATEVQLTIGALVDCLQTIPPSLEV